MIVSEASTDPPAKIPRVPFDIPDEVYEHAFNKVNGQYEESVRINNVYNRMILFDGNTQHAAQTFGSKTDRLTLNFFLKNITGPQQPFIRE